MAELQYRFNRRFDLKAMMPRFLRASVLTLPQPSRILRLSEVGLTKPQQRHSNGLIKAGH